MRELQPVTQMMKATDARREFASVINRVARKEGRVLVEKSGVPVAGIVSADDLRRLERLDKERDERFSVIDEMRAAFKNIPPEELEREADRALAEVRAERNRASTHQ